MKNDLQGKVAIITGGTSGNGRDTAVLFAEAGAKVVVAGRREAEGNETVDLIRKAGGVGLFVQTDVSKARDIEALVRRSVEKFWGDSAFRDSRTIDVHIRHLREKLERDPEDPEYLFTVRGVGYRFRDKDRDRNREVESRPFLAQ